MQNASDHGTGPTTHTTARRQGVILDFIPESTRAAGLGALMKGAGLVTRFIPIPQPTLLVGPGSSGRLGQAIAGFGHAKILIVTDAIIAKLGLLKQLTDALTAGGAQYVVFDEITPDAPIPLIERGIDFYRRHDCDAIVAFGGGSSMDASKAIAAAIATGKPLRDLAGYLKSGLRNPVRIYAVPTTAGTGSEVTVAAVIADPETPVQAGDHRPAAGAEDGGAGPDADDRAAAAHHRGHRHRRADACRRVLRRPLDHALLRRHGAVGRGPDLREPAHRLPRRQEPGGAREDVAGLHLRRLCLHARQRRLRACHRPPVRRPLPHAARPGQRHHAAAGAAVTRCRPSPTGWRCWRCVLASASEGEDEDVLAQKFLDAVRPAERTTWASRRHLEALREADIPALAKAACAEGNTYPVPRYMTQQQCEEVIRQVLPPKPAPAAKKARAARKRPRLKPQHTRRQAHEEGRDGDAGLVEAGLRFPDRFPRRALCRQAHGRRRRPPQGLGDAAPPAGQRRRHRPGRDLATTTTWACAPSSTARPRSCSRW